MRLSIAAISATKIQVSALSLRVHHETKLYSSVTSITRGRSFSHSTAFRAHQCALGSQAVQMHLRQTVHHQIRHDAPSEEITPSKRCRALNRSCSCVDRSFKASPLYVRLLEQREQFMHCFTLSEEAHSHNQQQSMNIGLTS